jgi:hypothetical protein
MAKVKRRASTTPKTNKKHKQQAAKQRAKRVTNKPAVAPADAGAAPSPTPAPVAPATPVTATTAQRRQALKDKTMPALRLLLRKNDQITTGTKGQLIKRILDCVEHGNLPRCPACGRSRLQKTATGYRCPGGYDDDEYVFCGFVATRGEIKREPWQFETPGLV